MKKFLYTYVMLFVGMLIIVGLGLLLSVLIEEDETKAIVMFILVFITMTLLVVGAMILPKRIIRKQNLKKLNSFLENLHIDSESMFERITYKFLNKNLNDIIKVNSLSSQVLPNIYEYGGIDLTVKIVRVNLDNIHLMFNEDSFSVFIYDVDLKDKLFKNYFNNDFIDEEEVFVEISKLCNEVD